MPFVKQHQECSSKARHTRGAEPPRELKISRLLAQRTSPPDTKSGLNKQSCRSWGSTEEPNTGESPPSHQTNNYPDRVTGKSLHRRVPARCDTIRRRLLRERLCMRFPHGQGKYRQRGKRADGGGRGRKSGAKVSHAQHHALAASTKCTRRAPHFLHYTFFTPGAVYQGRTARGRLVHKGVERTGDRLVLSGDTLYESGYFSVQSACFVGRDGKRALLVGTL